MSDDLYTILAKPKLEHPTAIMFLEGWIDAGNAAAVAASRVHDALEDEVVVASFDPDEFVDYRARRPVLHLADGVVTTLTWPRIEVIAGHIDGADVVMLMGQEPDTRWRRFSEAVVEIFGQLGAERVVGLGAYPAPTPHTRPVRLSATATTDALAEGYVRASIDAPAGVHAVIETAAAEAGIDAIGIWAQVPHYVAASFYPAAASELLRDVARVTGARLDTSELDADGLRLRNEIDERVAENPEHAGLLAELERTYDSLASIDDSAGDAIAREFEEFLRDQEED